MRRTNYQEIGIGILGDRRNRTSLCVLKVQSRAGRLLDDSQPTFPKRLRQISPFVRSVTFVRFEGRDLVDLGFN